MRRIVIATLAGVLLAGCVSVEQADNTAPSFLDIAGMSRRFIATNQVRKGMAPGEVNGILGSEVVIGYQLLNRKIGLYRPITVKNPFRTQTVTKGRRSYRVDYYLAGIRKADGKVSDDELIPMVFLDGKLAGSGWDFFHKLSL